MGKKYFLILIVSINSWYFLYAQELENVSYHLENDTVYVQYDFLKGASNTDYEFYLYSSLDNFKTPLKNVSGDIGKHVRTGSNKLVKWAAVKELGTFKGDISLKIKGEKYIPFVKFENIPGKFHLTRGKDFELHWTTASDIDKIDIQIYRFNVPVTEIQKIPNTGAYILNIPNDLKAGKGYQAKISNPGNPMKAEMSEMFTIRRSWPLSLKIIPVVGVAVAGGFMLGQNTPGPDIEDPPSPPNLR